MLSFWTVFIADNKKNEAGVIPDVNITANMFPGRVTSDHVMIHTSPASADLYHIPLDYSKDVDLPGLMSVDSWLKGGYDGVKGVKLLVCVKSIGATRKLKVVKTGNECEIMDVIVFDDTAEVRMTFWNELIESAREWVPGVTVLLVSNPGYKLGYGNKGCVSILFSTMIDVEPRFDGAEWLRRYAAAQRTRESVVLEVPEDVFDADAAANGLVRMLFTLAEFDRWRVVFLLSISKILTDTRIRLDPIHTLTGYINVTILDMSLVSIHRRNMLMCTECCGVPLYSNFPSTPCRNCSKSRRLSLNPRIIGTLADETGCIAPGKLVWSTRAWEQLFGRRIEDIAGMTGEEARWFEQRMLWLRVHMVVGWEEGVGRLCVLGVKM